MQHCYTHYRGTMGRGVIILITKIVCECLASQWSFPSGCSSTLPKWYWDSGSPTGIFHQHQRRPKLALDHQLQPLYTENNLSEGPLLEVFSLSLGLSTDTHISGYVTKSHASCSQSNDFTSFLYTKWGWHDRLMKFTNVLIQQYIKKTQLLQRNNLITVWWILPIIYHGVSDWSRHM